MDESVYVIADCQLCCNTIGTVEEQIVCGTCSSQFHKTCVKNDNMQSWGCPSCCKDNPPTAPRSYRSKKHSKAPSNKPSTKDMTLMKTQDEVKHQLKSEDNNAEHRQSLKTDKNIQQIINNCGQCKKPIGNAEKRHVCSVCKALFHVICVEVADLKEWACSECQQIHKPSPGSKNISKNGKSNRTSSSKAKALLDTLEEERKLLEKQAEEKERLLKETHDQQIQLLKKKQDVLQEMVSSKSSSSTRSGILDLPSVSSQKKVRDWINTQRLASFGPDKVLEHDGSLQAALATTKTGGCNEKTVNFHSSTRMPSSMMNSTFNVEGQRVGSSTMKNQPNMYRPEQVSLGAAVDNRHIFTTNDQREVVNSTFNVANPETSQYQSTFMKHNLSREEVAARHVVKELPKFDGTPKLWPKFISSYHRSTKICGYNDSENLERLNHSLTGKAYIAVKTSLNLDENVPRILETLETLFGKPEFIIRSLVDDLKTFPQVSADSIESIIHYSLEVENISVTMKVAKLSNHLWNSILLSDMIEKLPCSLKLEWASYKYSNPNSNIEVFAMWLKEKAMTYSTILVKPPSFSTVKQPHKEKHSNKEKHTVHVHQETHTQKCVVCSGKCNTFADCKKFKESTLGDKWNIVRKHQICRICLTKHRAKLCSKDELCGIDGCQFRHHSLLHKTKEPQKSEPQNSPALPQDVNVHVGENRTYFKVLPLFLRNGTKTMEVFAMLDDGSSITLIDDSVTKFLELKGETQPLCLRWTKGVERMDNKSELVSLNVSQYQGGPEFIMRGVHTVEGLSLPKQTIDMEELCNTYEHLKGIPIKSFKNAQPLLLIGLNNSKCMAVKKYRFGRDNEPSAAKTGLGWCIFGKTSSDSSKVFHINHCNCQVKLDDRLEDIVLENYSLDAIGVNNLLSTPRSNDDSRAFKILETTAKFNGSRYEVGLLWKYDNTCLPDNFQLAVRRHKCLEKRFSTEPNLCQVISDHIQEYLEKGYARELNQNESKVSSWYLPIFIVRNPNKPDKVRLVWDAAAEMNGLSLNKMLLKGPDLLASLPGVLLRFREHRVALTGDIKEMFHQIVIREEDQRFQRFIWRSNADEQFKIFEMNVMTFGASCSPSCSQYIKNINAEKQL